MNEHPTTDLATRINTEHHAAVEAAQSALAHAGEAGRLLLEAKQAVPHGEWGAWLTEHVEFSERTAQGYMRVASRWEELNPQRVADLSLRGALRLLATPSERSDADRPAFLPPEGHHAFATVPGPVGTQLWAYVIPSAEHEGFYYTNLFIDHADSATVEGGPNPIRSDWVGRALESAFPLDAEWDYYESEPWTYNHMLFKSHDDYVCRHVLAGKPATGGPQ